MIYLGLMEKLSFEKLGNFFSQFKLLHYKRRETILRADDIPPGVFYLKKGYVRLYSLSSEGEELTLIIFKPEDFFPMMWAINNINTPYYLETITAVELWRAPREEFVKFIKSNPDILFELISRMLVRFGGVLRRMEYLTFGNAHAQVASIVLICAERFGRQEGSNTIIQVPLTHKNIGNLVGVTRETTSLEIKKLEKKGLIGYQGRHIVVKNIQRLKKESLFEESL